MRFLGLGLWGRVPYAKTLWLFRERLTQTGVIDSLFNRFDATLVAFRSKAAQYKRGDGGSSGGTDRTRLAGRTCKDAPQGSSCTLASEIHKGETGQDDGTIPSTDLAIPFFGYKSHIPIDRKFRLIRKWKATDAAASDGARSREGQLDSNNTAFDVWGDMAYRSKANEAFMEKHGFVSKVHRTKLHLKPMPCHIIQRSNAGKSVIRSCVEHIFAD